jgi:hypothetical protein
MTHPAVIRVLLSLLLLVSQQMAMSHVISHWAGSREAAAFVQQQEEEDDSGLSESIAKDQSCHQCLALAQLAAALGNTPRYFAAADTVSRAAVATATQPVCGRPVCGFQSRAPPQA